MARISGVVIALNEADQLHYALSTLRPWCDEVIVVDQHSEDDTARIAEEMGATVYQHERTGGIADPGVRIPGLPLHGLVPGPCFRSPFEKRPLSAHDAS